MTILALECLNSINGWWVPAQTGAVFAENIANAMIAAEEIETGLFYVNTGTIGAEAHLPTGGMKGFPNGDHETSIAAIDSCPE